MASNTQITEDFSLDNSILYQVDGDGTGAYNTNGNPGGCLRVDETANSQIHHLLLPNFFYGDWSGALTSDDISFDIFVQSFSGGQVTEPEFVFELSGPGGAARAWPNYQLPSLSSWHTLSIDLDPAEWNIVSGSWSELLENVQLCRIRTEYILGDEYCLVDNISTSFTPVNLNPFTGDLCSDFTTLGGWDFEGEATVEIVSNAGGVPPAVRLTDLAGATTFGIAPPSYTGDWSELDGSGVIEYDVKIETFNTPEPTKEILILNGLDGSQASFIAPVVNTNDWQTFTAPIIESEWQMNAGTWSGLLSNVAEVRLGLEFVIGGETVYLDNFCVNDYSEECTDPVLFIPETVGDPMIYNCNAPDGYFVSDQCFADVIVGTLGDVTGDIWDQDLDNAYDIIVNGCWDPEACNYSEGAANYMCSDSSSCVYEGELSVTCAK